ncbi:MAG: hypothetical protein HY532_00585 [Chloroflexi bacterium]|nr:hypothetical protein [Chloroflexota bacterium]
MNLLPVCPGGTAHATRVQAPAEGLTSDQVWGIHLAYGPNNFYLTLELLRELIALVEAARSATTPLDPGWDN